MRTDRFSVAPFRVVMFRRLWGASLFVNLGFLMQMVAASWVILEETGSPAWVSLMVGAPLLPMLFLSLPAGAAADVLDRRLLLAVSCGIMAAATAGMAVIWLTGVSSPGLLVTLGLVVGIGDALFNPAWQASVPTVVPIALLPDAVALNSASAGIATAFGPALGGVMVATVGPGWAFIAAFVGYLPLIWVVLTAPGSGWNHGAGSLGIAMTIGLRYLRFSPDYRWLLLLGCLFGFTSAALQSMLPNITQDVLHGGSTLYGVLLGAFGIGAVVGGLTRAWGAHLLADFMVPVSVLLYGGAGITAGLSQSAAVTVVVMLIGGVVWTWILATLNSTFQALTPDWVRGRTMSAYVLAVFGFRPIGSIASGVLGERIGAAESLMVFSVLMIALAAVVAKMPFPVLERIESPTIVESALEPDAEQMPEGQTTPSTVMIISSWEIADADLAAFLDVLTELRRLRLSTGAYQWKAYRAVTNAALADRTSIKEVYLLHSWDHYLQHTRRIDVRGHDLIEAARRLADPGTHTSQCLVGVWR